MLILGMKMYTHKVKFKNKDIYLDLLLFDNSDKKIFKEIFVNWSNLNKTITGELKGTRKTNFPDALSESIFCLEMDCGKLISSKNSNGYSTSFDCYDYKRDKRIQVKCSSSKGPTSFGPRSQYDEIYFIDFFADYKLDGSYKIYLLENSDIDNIKVNKKHTLKDQQDKDRRPRFDIRSQLIGPKKIQPVKSGKL